MYVGRDLYFVWNALPWVRIEDAGDWKDSFYLGLSEGMKKFPPQSLDYRSTTNINKSTSLYWCTIKTNQQPWTQSSPLQSSSPVGQAEAEKKYGDAIYEPKSQRPETLRPLEQTDSVG